jgi:hypothetical protein
MLQKESALTAVILAQPAKSLDVVGHDRRDVFLMGAMGIK